MSSVAEANSRTQISNHKRRDVFLFSHPRTASNLLCHLLSDQPGWIQAHYHFETAFKFIRKSLDQGPITDISREQYQQLQDLLSEGVAKLYRDRDKAIVEVSLCLSFIYEPRSMQQNNLMSCYEHFRLLMGEQNKCLFVKNHIVHIWEPSSLWQNVWGEATSDSSHQCLGGSASTLGTNLTIFSDDFLKFQLPIILIQHPALVFESWYRAESRVESINILDKSWELYTTLRYSRQLYDWLILRTTNSACEDGEHLENEHLCKPTVISADDIIQNETTIEKLCELCNMDPMLIRYQWEVMGPKDDTVSSRHLSYMAGLWSSTSIDKSKTSRGLNMDTKYNQWKDEFGFTVLRQQKTRIVTLHSHKFTLTVSSIDSVLQHSYWEHAGCFPPELEVDAWRIEHSEYYQLFLVKERIQRKLELIGG